MAFTLAGGGGNYQTSGTADLVLGSNAKFTSNSNAGSANGTFAYTQTIGAHPGPAKIVLAGSADPTSFVTSRFTSAKEGFFYRTDATQPNGHSTFNDFQYGTFNLGFTTTNLAFAQQPTTTIAGQTISHMSAITPSLIVDILDSHGNPVSGDNSNVTIALTNLNGTLNGTHTVQAVNGVATFSIFPSITSAAIRSRSQTMMMALRR